MLIVDRVSLEHDREILSDISFQLRKNEILGIIGKSGAGKTSLLKIIGGLKDATSGKVIFDENEVVGPSVKLVPGHDDIQLVNQDFGLDMFHTTEQNIREKILYLPTALRNKFVDELLSLVELEVNRNQPAHTLSGGEQQRLSIARALACEPKLLLLDEPFVHLDARLKLKITNYLLEMKTVRAMSIILVSHDGEEILSLCEKVMYLKEGKIVRITTPIKAYYNFKTKEEGELLGWVNAVRYNSQTIFFRSDEYELSNSSENGIAVEFLSARFSGGYFLNSFRTDFGKNIVLLSLESLEKIRKFEIRKKNKKP